MAVKHIVECDKCGVVENAIEIEYHGFGFGTVYTPPEGWGDASANGDRYTLCPDCLKKVKKVMRGAIL